MAIKTGGGKKPNPRDFPVPQNAHITNFVADVYLCDPIYAVNSYCFSARDVVRLSVILVLFTESVMWSVVGVTLELNLAN